MVSFPPISNTILISTLQMALKISHASSYRGNLNLPCYNFHNPKFTVCYFSPSLTSFRFLKTKVTPEKDVKRVVCEAVSGAGISSSDANYNSYELDKMADNRKEGLHGLLTVLPPVEFCCVYGSTLHPNNTDQSRMIDYILGVRDPLEWHSQNLKMNMNHYVSWMVYLGGAKTITRVADNIGVRVHFNPYVSWNNKTFKYGVVRMSDLVEDVQNWKNFYLCGRLQKPVNVVVDNLVVKQMNLSNLRAATSAALLLLPDTFSEEDLYAKICSLSYMGDLRMLFAEDKHKVRKIVQGQFDLFKGMYRPVLEEFVAEDLLSFSSLEKLSQDCGLSAVQSVVSRLPTTVKNSMGMMLGMQKKMDSGRVAHEVIIKSRVEAANCMEKIIRRKVRISSIRQAVSGVLTVGAARASRYVANKMSKAWNSSV